MRKQQSGPTRTVTRPGRRRPWLIKSECGPSSGVGTLGWPDRCRRGGPLQERWKRLLRGTSLSGSLSSGQNKDGAQPGRTWATIIDHNRCGLPILILSLRFPANPLQPPLVLRRWLGPSSCQLWVSPPQSRASASSQVARSLGQSGDSPADLVPFHTHLIYPPRVGAPGSAPAPSQG